MQIVARRLFGNKPLAEPMLDYDQLDQWQQISLKYVEIKITQFSFKNMHLKMSSVKWRPFCRGLSVLKCYLE